MSKLSREHAAIIGAYTGYLCGPFEDMHKLIEEVLGRPVWTHELASKKLSEEIRAAVLPKFKEICADREPVS